MMLTRFKKSVTQPYGYLQINEFTKKKLERHNGRKDIVFSETKKIQ